MKAMYVTTIAALAVALGTFACSGESQESRPTADSTALGGGSLIDRTFLLVESEGYTLVDGVAVRMSFGPDEFAMHAGCNTHDGVYGIDGDTLVVTSISSTEMGCDAPLQAQDEWLREFLRSGPSVRLEGDTLTLRGGTATLTFRDRVVADPDQPLAGPRWNIDTRFTEQAATNVSYDAVPWVRFTAAGAFRVETGCTIEEGFYTATETQLVFSDVVHTGLACEPKLDATEAVALEMLVRKLFAGTANYSIHASRLTILHVDGTGIGAYAAE